MVTLSIQQGMRKYYCAVMTKISQWGRGGGQVCNFRVMANLNTSKRNECPLQLSH